MCTKIYNPTKIFFPKWQYSVLFILLHNFPSDTVLWLQFSFIHRFVFNSENIRVVCIKLSLYSGLMRPKCRNIICNKMSNIATQFKYPDSYVSLGSIPEKSKSCNFVLLEMFGTRIGFPYICHCRLQETEQHAN